MNRLGSKKRLNPLHVRGALLAIALSIPVADAGSVAGAGSVADAGAQTTIATDQPRSCQPGKTTRLVLSGKDVDRSLRVMTTHPAAAIEIESADRQKAVVSIRLPEEAPLGPLVLWTATQERAFDRLVLLVDDLPTSAEDVDHHTRETAQQISTMTAVDGTSDGPRSDFYQFRVAQGQRVAFEVLTQDIESEMDPILQLLDIEGNVLHSADDDGIGPDCRFSYRFSEAGDYLLEVRDSRYAAGGDYHLRVGDFPILSHCIPLAVQRGRRTTVNFVALDDGEPEARELEVPTPFQPDALHVATRLDGGLSSAWVPLQVCDAPQICEQETDDPQATEPLSCPMGVTGTLSAAQQRDQFTVGGLQDTLVRFTSRTRSLGCQTLLRMRLLDSDGNQLAETKVSESDEWSFDYKFPKDGDYRLEVTDLLGRGGERFGYWVNLTPSGTFAIALKADAKTGEQFVIEQEHGGCAIELQIDRFGYEGEIDLSLVGGATGLRILNPRIAAKSKTAKIYLAADHRWEPDTLTSINLVAQARDDPGKVARVDGLALYRVKTPHVPFPASSLYGGLLVSGANCSESYYTLEPAAPIVFARSTRQHQATLKLKRIDKEFKSAVSVLPNSLPTDWRVAVKASQDDYQATFTRVGAQPSELATVPLLLFTEFNGRGRIESAELPVQWVDPLRISIEPSSPLVAGNAGTLVATVERAGNDPQPVTIKFSDVPAGIVAPEPLSIAADQTRMEIPLQLTPEASGDHGVVLGFQASSKFQGSDLSLAGETGLIQIINSPSRIEIHPLEIMLDGIKGRQQLVVTGYDAAESPRDWTQDVRLTTVDQNIAEVRGSVVYPKANGETEVIVQHGKLRGRVPVRVSNIDSKPPTQFESEVLVALSKQGCNSGACHGSPSGKGGFRLSLRAFDRALDELTLIREEFGRRVNPLDPGRSLLLLKPLMKVSHGGGTRLHADDAAYAILRDWIAEGAGADPPDTSRCVRLEVYPDHKRVLQHVAGGQQLAVTAHFGDGSSRDVTDLVAYQSSNPSVATVDRRGRVTAHGRGEAVILVRFLEHIETVPLMFVAEIPDFEWHAPQPNNFIDRLVYAKLRQMRYLPSATCDDSEFLRRVYLDVIGILPTVQESAEFLDDNDPSKRERLIDRLLERDEFAKFWALKWGDLLKMTSQAVGNDGVYKYHRWLTQTLRDNLPYDQFALQLLTASGSTLANPPANFYRTAANMNECVETISQVFLGARLQCAKCHNHPFERWTQDNYYGLGAFFDRVQRRQTQRPGEMFIWTEATGEVIHPRTGQQMKPWLPGTGTMDLPADQDRREVFAAWMIDAENPYFATIEANRIWSQLFARGIVEPIDDFRESNPPSNEPLLEALTREFIDSGFDRKHLLRTILRSRTYQASFQTNRFNHDDTSYFSHQMPRLLGAEQLLDAVSHTTGLPQTLGGLPAGTKATHLPAPDIVQVDFLKVFGQPQRTTVCACERAGDSNLGMAIELFNGPTIHAQLRDPENRFRRAVAAGRETQDVVRELYLAAVCRPPSDVELQAAIDQCQKRSDVVRGLEDVCWALLNTDEFLFQH